MDYKDIENKLKSDAKKINQKDFSARWDELQDRIDGTEAVETQTVPVLAAAGATENLGGNNILKQPLKLTFLILVAALIISLAIVLPIVLTKDSTIYFNEDQLVQTNVDDSDFYTSLEKAGIEIIDLSGIEPENYRLFFTDNNEIKGGGFEFIDEELGCIGHAIFYDSTVMIKDLSDYELYSIENKQIKYKLTEVEDYFEIIATTVYQGVFYRFNCSILENNIDEIFKKIFT